MTIAKISKKKLAKLNGKVPFSSITASRKAPRKRNPKRKASEFKRCYGSKARVEFVKGLPCAACGVVGYSENAHLTPKSEKGTGYRGACRFIAPLCGLQSYSMGGKWALDYMGCHKLHDEYPYAFATTYPEFNSEQAARQTEIAYQNHLKGESAK